MSRCSRCGSARRSGTLCGDCGWLRDPDCIYRYVIEMTGSSHGTAFAGADTVARCRRHFENWVEEIGRYGDERSAEAVIYYTGADDVHRYCRITAQDLVESPPYDWYPYWQLCVGPRGGIRREQC